MVEMISSLLSNIDQTIACRWLEKHARLRPPEGQPDPEIQSRLRSNYYVYVVVTTEPFGRVGQGAESNVLYVGRGTGDRALELMKGTHSALPALARAGYARLRGRNDVPMRILIVDCGANKETAILRESQVLTQIAWACGEMPPCNIRWEGYVIGGFLQALVELSAREEERLTVYDWPRDHPHATWVDVTNDHKKWMWSLVWTWPSDRLGGQDPTTPDVLTIAARQGVGDCDRTVDKVFKAARDVRFGVEKAGVNLQRLEQPGGEELFVRLIAGDKKRSTKMHVQPPWKSTWDAIELLMENVK